MAEQRNTYELTYILNAVLSEDQIKDLVQRIRSFIEENGGEVIDQDEWGSRRLTYPIQKKRNGYYVNLHFRATGALIARLERSLEINEDVLRYLTLRLDRKMIRNYEQRRQEGSLLVRDQNGPAGGEDEEDEE